MLQWELHRRRLRITEDLTGKLPEEWRAFNKKFISVYLAGHPDKTKVAAGLACGLLWTVCKGIKRGDIVLCPNGNGQYHIGEVCGDYFFQPGEVLPHRRSVHWLAATIDRVDMSDALKKSTGATGTVSNVTGHTEEIERLIGGSHVPVIVSTDETVEDPAAFALEKHLEDFLVANWAHTDLGREYDIYEEEGECVGQQYPTDTGPIDILAVSKDKKQLLVIELKRGGPAMWLWGRFFATWATYKENWPRADKPYGESSSPWRTISESDGFGSGAERRVLSVSSDVQAGEILRSTQ